MRPGAWAALASTSGRVAGAALSICYHLRGHAWLPATWAEPTVVELLGDWQPSPAGIDTSLMARLQRERVLVDEEIWAGCQPLSIPEKLRYQLCHEALVDLRLQERPQALLCLKFRQRPHREQLLALADLVEVSCNCLLSRQHMFLEQVPLVFVCSDADGIVCSTNREIEKLGYTPEEVIGKDSEIFFPPGERERLRNIFPASGFARYEGTIRNRAGELIPAELLVCRMRDETGRLLERAVLGRDLRPELRREHHNRLDAVGRLVAGVAQELNSPLLTVVGNMEMLLGTKLSVGARRRAERALVGARRCLDVVENLIKLPFRRRPLEAVVELAPLLRSAVDVALAELPGQHIELELPGEILQVKGEAADLELAVVHLLRNALQAVEGRADAAVKLTLTHREHMASINISDNGPGMQPDVLGRAFEPFFSTGKGKGLGLSIAMGVVQNHDGYIELRCSQGTSATMNLPLLVR